MDFIITKLNGLIDVSEKNSVDMQTLLRERIEYIFYLVLGYLWNENFENIHLKIEIRLLRICIKCQ